MQIFSKACGSYQTNCYIVQTEFGELIIDPGEGAHEWIKQIVKNPLAILNTHGHFDHVWDNQKTKEAFDIPIYAPKDDCFMLSGDVFGFDVPPSKADIETSEGEYKIGGVYFKFLSFPGHTPGCSAVQIEDALFSGDFIFKGSIGRVDFPYSNPQEMKKSLEKFLGFTKDLTIYPGHGDKTSVLKEKANAKGWLAYLFD